jgi:hypothetical protein
VPLEDQEIYEFKGLSQGKSDLAANSIRGKLTDTDKQ